MYRPRNFIFNANKRMREEKTFCSNCKFREVTPKAIAYSLHYYGKELCYTCQDIEKKDRQLKDAKAFLNYNIKEGVYDEEMFNGWSDQELIDFAEKEMDRADHFANSYIED